MELAFRRASAQQQPPPPLKNYLTLSLSVWRFALRTEGSAGGHLAEQFTTGVKDDKHGAKPRLSAALKDQPLSISLLDGCLLSTRST